jgi:hypothetical protein
VKLHAVSEQEVCLFMRRINRCEATGHLGIGLRGIGGSEKVAEVAADHIEQFDTAGGNYGDRNYGDSAFNSI